MGGYCGKRFHGLALMRIDSTTILSACDLNDLIMNSKERHQLRYERRKAKRKQKELERAKYYTDFDNVFGYSKLIKGYLDTSKASKKRTATSVWMSNLCVNARREQLRLLNGTWKSRGFNSFTIMERGKIRDIKSVHISEKGIQNAFSNNCLIPILAPHLIYDNGASMKGKGTDFSIMRFVKHLRKQGRNGYVFFFDFKGYFSNINNELLLEKVNNKIVDERMISIYELFVRAFGDKGLGLGSQISQISAVYYPNQIDHMIKDKLKITGFGRHMDDGYIICDNLERLEKIVELFYRECDKLEIIPNQKKCRIVKLTRQFRFLKRRFFITETGKVVVRPNREMAKKERQRLKAYRKFYDMGLMKYEDIYLNFHSWLFRKPFFTCLDMIKYFNSLFPEYRPYRPLKRKTYQQRKLDYIARSARKENNVKHQRYIRRTGNT